MKYAGVFSRAVAALVDGIVLVPCIVLFVWTASLDGAWQLMALPLGVVGPAYKIWFHARSGQTLGKRFIDIRVVRETGERISWREAFLRSVMDIVLGVALSTAMTLVLYQLSRAQPGLGWLDRMRQYVEHGPTWSRYLGHASTAWFWTEVVFFFSNSKRRAVHDFIAGTVVVHESLEAAAHAPSSVGSA